MFEAQQILLARSSLISLRSIFHIILPDTPRLSKKPLPLRFPDQNFACASLALLKASPIARPSTDLANSICQFASKAIIKLAVHTLISGPQICPQTITIFTNQTNLRLYQPKHFLSRASDSLFLC
jgi:hypothetical protein